jgi:biofilm PGA synthesis N-glycosyltransferase PgaC
MAQRLSYAVVTPVRNEAENLGRLAVSLSGQTARPAAWVIVDTGSTDETVRVAQQLALRHPWVSVEQILIGATAMRGGPIVRAFHAGLRAVPETCDIIVKLDADISMDPDYFERLVAEFEHDERLGIAGGIGYERQADGVWRQRHGTGASVWGASRGYRRTCLDKILPLEERMGWDTIDLVAAEVRGWRTRAFLDIPFLHHRSEGERDPSRFSIWLKQGHAAHYMGYRFSYLAIRILYRAARDPWAVGIAWGYLGAALRREPRCADTSVRAHVRQQQRISQLPRRAREAMRRRAVLEPPSSAPQSSGSAARRQTLT